MITTFRPSTFFARMLCAVLAVLHLLVFSSAQAAVPPMGGTSTQYIEDMIAGNRNITRNNTGAVIINLPASETSDAIFGLFKGDGIIWARWYRLAGAGTIQVVKSVWTPQVNEAGSHMHLVITNFDPETASKNYVDYQQNSPIKNYYAGVDPFAPFKQGNGMWNKTARNEFLTAVGQAAMMYSVNRAYIATAFQRDDMRTWNKCIVKVLGACLKKRYFQELKTYVKPTWTVGTAMELARGRTYASAFLVKGCNEALQSCVMQSGMGFVEASAQSDFPMDETLVSTIEHHNDAWTGLAFAILFATIAIIAAPLLLDAPGLMAAVLNSAAVGTVESVAAAWAIDALGYALVSLALNGGGSITDGQDGLFGNLGNIPVAGEFQPTNIKPEWDMRPQVIDHFLKPPMEQVGGGVSTLMEAKPVDMSGTAIGDFWAERVNPPLREGGLPATQ